MRKASNLKKEKKAVIESEAAHDKITNKSDFPIVGIGASAGGLEAFISFLEVFPPQSGMAIIFVQHLDPTHYPDWETFLVRNPARRLWFFTTKADRRHTEVAWQDGDGLVFGRETAGLPPEILAAFPDNLVKIPMPGDFHRSLNLAQAAAVGLYEALRQTQGW